MSMHFLPIHDNNAHSQTVTTAEAWRPIATIREEWGLSASDTSTTPTAVSDSKSQPVTTPLQFISPSSSSIFALPTPSNTSTALYNGQSSFASELAAATSEFTFCDLAFLKRTAIVQPGLLLSNAEWGKC